FGSTVDGANALTITGDAVFEGEVGSTTAVTTLLVTGTTDINTDKVDTTGTQEYSGAVTLTADTNLTATSVTFDSTLDGAHALTVPSNGTFGGEVGQTTNLSSLHVTGTSAINTDKITTTGTQAYDTAVTLGSDANLTGTTVTFASTVDGAHALTVNATTGAVT